MIAVRAIVAVVPFVAFAAIVAIHFTANLAAVGPCHAIRFLRLHARLYDQEIDANRDQRPLIKWPHAATVAATAWGLRKMHRC